MTDNQYSCLMETVEDLTACVAELKSLLISNMEQINRVLLEKRCSPNEGVVGDVNPNPVLGRADNEFNNRQLEGRAGLGRVLWHADSSAPRPYDPINLGPHPVTPATESPF